MAASFLFVFPGSNVDVYSHGARGNVFVGVLCGDYDSIRHFKLYAFGREPMLAFASVQVFGHARDMVKPVSWATNKARCCKVGRSVAVAL